jgi:ferrochelatase
MLQNKKLILLLNLGSPNNLDVASIKLFLAKFLSDKKVVRLPKLFWYPILYLIILPFRSKKLLAKYSSIWNNGAPLINYTNQQSINLKNLFSNNNNIIVKHAFSYSKPYIIDILSEVKPKEVVVLPLYPQFSSTTTLPILNQMTEYFNLINDMPTFKLIRGFHNNSIYIDLLVEKIQRSWQINGRSEKLIFSYHSLPVSIIKSGDPYYDECVETTTLIAKKLGLEINQYLITFQSRFGAEKWLTPSTTQTLINLAKNKIESIDIICPGFISDCLETLEEIAILNKKEFLKNGGKNYNYIYCLNNENELNQLFLNLIK